MNVMRRNSNLDLNLLHVLLIIGAGFFISYLTQFLWPLRGTIEKLGFYIAGFPVGFNREFLAPSSYDGLPYPEGAMVDLGLYIFYFLNSLIWIILVGLTVLVFQKISRRK